MCRRAKNNRSTVPRRRERPKVASLEGRRLRPRRPSRRGFAVQLRMTRGVVRGRRMSKKLIANGYVVTVDPARNVFAGGYVAVDGARTSAVGAGAQHAPAH